MSFVRQQASYVSREHLADGMEILKSSGIIEHYRKLFLFIDKREFINTKNVTNGKAFLINFSLNKKKSNSFTNNANLLHYVINMYSFNVEFILGWKNRDQALCTLLEAYSNDAYYDLDRKLYYPENQILYDNYNTINSQFLKESLIDMEYNSYDVIPEPIYYTSIHQFNKTREVPELLNSFAASFIYRLKELKDENTTITVLDINNFQSFVENKKFQLKRAEMLNSNINLPVVDIKQIVSDLFYYNAETLLEGLVFSYDTLIGDVAVHNPKWKVTMSFSNSRPEEQKINHIFEMKNRIKSAMELIEKEHGNVLMFYCPWAHGDNFNIHFRDYKKDSQPVTISSDNIDKMYSLDTVITDCMSTVDAY